MASLALGKNGVATVALVLMIAGAIPAAPAQTAGESAAPSTAPSTATTGQTPPHHRAARHRAHALSPAQAVERRIAELHRRLEITAEQEPLWGVVAGVMREDAQAVEAAAKLRQEKLGTMSAVDNLRSFQVLAQTHADGLNKLTDAFATLYAAMSDGQKRNADAVFRYQAPGGAARRAGPRR